MLISEPIFAAAYRQDGSDARIFDDIQCLLNATSGEANPERLRFWFHDAATAVWIDRTEAVFVRSARLRTPMAGGFVAYRGAAAAARGARLEGEVVGSLSDLFREDKERRRPERGDGVKRGEAAAPRETRAGVGPRER
jgi:hypothetical protein